MNQFIAVMIQRFDALISSFSNYSGNRKNEWYIEKRTGENVIPGTAIGFSYTPKDRSLIPGMLKSFYFAEYVISYCDNTDNPSFEYNESERHKAIIRKARKAGAKYFWGVGPKRRVSEEAIQLIRENLHLLDEGNIIMTNYRFFWGANLNNIRTDSPWGKRVTSAFFPISHSNRYGRKPLHHRWRPKNLPKIHLDINQYYIGRHTEDIIKKKFDFYKSRDYKTKFWKSVEINDLVSSKVTTKEVTENIRGIGYREKHFQG